MPTANPLHPPKPPLDNQKQIWTNLQGSSLSLSIASLAKEAMRPLLIVTPDSISANRLLYEISFFLGEQKDIPVLEFPDWETLPYDQFSPHQDIISSRLSTLYRIHSMLQGIVITPVTTLMHRLSPRDYLHTYTFLLKQGDRLTIESTRQNLEKAGYRIVSQVQEHGEFAVRGSIIDLFPMGSQLPYRIDLFDDEIDSIRTFSPDTQRTIDKIDKIDLLPAKEFPLTDSAIELFRTNWRAEFSGNPLNHSIYQDISEGICPPGIEYYLPFFFNQTENLFNYLPNNTLVLNLDDTHTKAEEFWMEIQKRYEQRSHDHTRPILNPSKIFIPVGEIFQQIKSFAHIQIEMGTVISESPYSFHFQTQTPPNLSVNHKAANPLQALDHFLKDFKKGRVLFCSETTGRREVLLQMLQNIHVLPKQVNHWQDFLDCEDPIAITVAPIEDGMLLLQDPAIAIIAEPQLFEKKIMQRRLRKLPFQDTDALVKDLTELQIGAPIVHIDHGVGRYLGLQTLQLGEVTSEFLALEYAGTDKLYVPVTSLHLIGRYTGTDPEHAPLHKLGTDRWSKAKRKAEEKAKDVAAELLDIYAKRAAYPGHAYESPNSNYARFAAGFPFEETPDQLRAIDDVIKDMTSDKPMDRLVCGDVGFGKTEVAMRAAFIAVQSNKQVAVMVPTTLLAQQHFQTFSDRFADWPIQVVLLSRFKSPKELKENVEKIRQGKADIVIGTHRLLQEDIQFKSLGLVIIDEEHRFGVQQKERLKALRASVDILALTATPIPRTLNMAFAGIRDLSIIATPPQRRLSIKTFHHEFNEPIIQEAILREILRGGQVYFLHNEVSSIERMAIDLEKLVSEARVSVAHGQMRERELEQVMSDFYHRRFNVLVCSTIIESGIDIPSANTIIINRADKFGLAQLHQLRGRVGRSHHQAYAFLLTPNRKLLTADAIKRLDAILSLEDLGVGFMLATHDLEIRGAGELLGEGQSGHMHEIGFTLYMDMLSRAVTALKSGKKIAEDVSPARTTEIDLQISALIPEAYLGDVQLRLQYYRKIATAKTEAALENIQIEMIDRFGLLPDQAKRLFASALLRQKAESLGIQKIEAHAKGGRIEFIEKPHIDPMKLIQLIQKQSDQFKMEGPTRLKFSLSAHEHKDRIQLIEAILKRLS